MGNPMKWEHLLNTNLFGDPEHKESPNRPHYAQDYDRLVFSAPFRRLANKTQVHPLYSDDHLHHRLIHSIETSSVGRSLGIEVAQWLAAEGEISDPKHISSLPGVVQAACIAHDIGNPPFGHSGEAAIGEWFKEKFEQDNNFFGEISDEQQAEFIKFEGNAQGFRLITRLEMYRHEGGMRLTNATLGAFTKYPTTASVSASANKTKDSIPYVSLKKFGIFKSELNCFVKVADSLGLHRYETPHGEYWSRHPLVFLVEAADDICYNIIDLEDAYVAGDISGEAALGLLRPLFGGTNRTFDSQIEEISYYRARAINAAIPACIEAFKNNYSKIMQGTFSSSLVKESPIASCISDIEEFSRNRIFSAPRKTRLEVSGRNTLHGVLEGMLPLFVALQDKGWNRDDLDGYFKQLAAASQVDLRDITDPYSALHALSDYVSGMTDRFAVKMHLTLKGTLD